MLLMGVIAAAALVPTVPAAAAQAQNGNRKPPPFDLLVQPAADMSIKGQECLSFCVYMLGEGVKELAPCARNVNELLALNTALQSLALQHGKQLGSLVPLVIAAAEACNSECQKFLQHAQCKACSEASIALSKACKQFQLEFAEFQRATAGRGTE